MVSGIKLYGALLVIIIMFSLIISSDSSANLDIHSIASGSNDEVIESPSAYSPALIEYKVNKSTEIWSAEAPAQYITPQDAIVQLNSKQLKLVKVDENTYIIQYEDGEPLRLNYVKDQEQFGVEDYWVNPSYYLSNEYNGKTLSGDCEDAVMAITSILIARGHSTVAILGYVNKTDSTCRHAWAETSIEGKSYIVNGTILHEKGYFQTTHEWSPRYMWNDGITFRDYSPEWNLKPN